MSPEEIKQHRVSLIVSTYNRPDALRVCLDSVKHQTTLPYEVIIGDDGSRSETADTIKEISRNFPVPIKHVWHEDNGFRLAMMRNKSVAASSGDYIIEVDGDVFLHPKFIEDHLREAAPGIYVKGGRTNLGKELTEEICRQGVSRRISWLTKGIESKPENALHLKTLAHYLAPRYRKHHSSALGCNMSFFKDDYIKINGYDEFFEGWGGEDVDFGVRMQKMGFGKRYLKFAGIVYHLWHEDKFMYNREKNLAYSSCLDDDKPARCANGVDKYLK